MRSSQWKILGSFFILVGWWFTWLYSMSGRMCRMPDISEPLNRLDIINCVRSEVLSAFIWILFPLGMIFFVGSWIESRAEKKVNKK